MAITKLLHMKEAKGSAGRHLEQAIRYILNPQKTKGYLLVGGNCGVMPQEVYAAMMQTKQEFGKIHGRQGYHFIISFAKDEGDIEVAYQFGQSFCDVYLQDRYDYVFAVHTDKEHLHIHIVFNSVAYDGYKYHYSQGDWKKDIQPLTDRLCRQYGLSCMVTEDRKKGVSYAEWKANQKGKLTKRSLLRRDIDVALAMSASYEEFLNKMHKMGYQIRAGISKKQGIYLAFTPPGEKKAYRSYTLGDDYGIEAIQKRVGLQREYQSHVPKIQKIRVYGPVQNRQYLSPVLAKTVGRYYRAGLFYPQRKGSCFGYQKDILAVDKLYQQCRYLLMIQIRDRETLHQKLENLKILEKSVKKEYFSIRLTEEERVFLQRYEGRKADGDTEVSIEGLKERAAIEQKKKEQLRTIRAEKRLIGAIETGIERNRQIKMQPEILYSVSKSKKTNRPEGKSLREDPESKERRKMR